MENAFADLIPGKTAAPHSSAASERQLQHRATQEQIESAGVNQAEGMQSILTAPITRARQATALQVDQATRDAQIRKALADANSAELENQIKALAAKYPNLQADQITTAARYNLMKAGEGLYQGALKKGYKPDALGNKVTYMLDKIPGIGTDVANLIRDPKAEQAQLGERNFTGGALRQETGAGGPKEERPELRSRYFTTPFMADTPDIRASLQKIRQQQIDTARRASGPLATPQLPPGLTPAGARSQAKAAIAAGKPRAVVLKRLQDMGVDIQGL